MTYLFEQPAEADVAVSLDATASDGGDASLEISLWNFIVGASSQETRALLSISRLQPLQPSGVQGVIPGTTVTVWCHAATNNISGVSVPHSWSQMHTKTFRSDLPAANSTKTHRISLVQPTTLDSITLLALSDGVFLSSQLHVDQLQAWLAQTHPFIQQGDTIRAPIAAFTCDNDSTVPLPSEPLVYQVVEAEPTASGLFDPATTRILLFATAEGPHNPNSSGEESDADDYLEIDEHFLGNSLLLPIPTPSSAANPELGATVEVGARGAGRRLQTSQEWITQMEPLSSPVTSHDDESVYLQTRDLSRIGVLNGDWAVVCPSHQACRRLVRVVASDTLVSDGRVLASPTLLHNISRGIFQPPSSESATVGLRCSPFGSRRPAIPVAREIMVARIASPASTDRANEPAFLRALKHYLSQSVRLVKEKDILAIPIDTDNKRHPGSDQEKEEAGAGEELPPEFPTASSPNDVVYFSITNVEHDVPQVTGEIVPPDMYVYSTVGELGCWVDATVTRIVQTGLEHSFVPRSANYLGMDSSRSQLHSNKAYQTLFSLSSAAISKDAGKYQLQFSVLLQGPRGIGKTILATKVAQALGIHRLEVNCFDILGESATQSEAFLQLAFEKASSCSPCMLVLKHIDAFSQATQSVDPTKGVAIAEILSQCVAGLKGVWASTGYPVLVVATTTTPEQVPAQISALFKHHLTIETPEDKGRHEILESLLGEIPVNPDVSIKELATETAAFVSRDLSDLTLRARTIAAKEALKVRGISISGSSFTQLKAVHVEAALGTARASHAESIGAPRIPQVSWDDVGGIAEAKADILDTIQLPLEHPELFAAGMKKRSGILLYGPPGTGKTLLAKAVATSCALNFFSVKGPELLNMYIGESEANVRRIFQKAKDARPCVIFFDELDSIAPKRGNHGDSGGVMDRIVSQLLAELDGVSSGSSGADVFVIGATNRPDLLDPALLRPGRFDRMLYLGVSTTNDAQLNILHALTRKFKLHPDLDLNEIVAACPFHFTGADFYALCADALMRAMSKKAEQVDLKIAKLNASPPTQPSPHPHPITPQYYLAEMAGAEDIEVLVSYEDFKVALDNLVPSVSPAEMGHYAQVQKQFSKNNIVN